MLSRDKIAGGSKTQPNLACQVELADSIPGVGALTAAVAVAELPPLERLEHAGQAVALAGLDPRQKTSGSSVHAAPRLSKMGSRLLRHNPIIRALGRQRLKAKGKGGKRAVAAAMRKLVRLIYGVLKQGKPFDPNWEKRTAPSVWAGEPENFQTPTDRQHRISGTIRLQNPLVKSSPTGYLEGRQFAFTQP